MSEAQAEWAIQSLYENPSARDELEDSQAETLLRWAEEQVMRLADLNMEDEQFEAAYDRLAGLVQRINRLAARRGHLPREDEEMALNRIAEYAAAIGITIPPDQLTTYLHQPPQPDIQANLHALLALVRSEPPPDTAALF
jgi:hypothetical protein